MAMHMLTTADNPFNPFIKFSEWEQFDVQSGYYTMALLARVVVSSDELSEADQLQAREEGIDTILREDESGLYLKVDASTGKVLV